ncbi:putative protein phosphatase 2C 24 [Camellia lanceoleosa]|uniref:Uncharacterized protein n=1 Tax=Camellia lanceoleosa TaxID=1840588 RepID=A0ACC0FRH3_9ERIC|nr:putative protein phosphatase 2C 24 [Camellia lanceoleosa]
MPNFINLHFKRELEVEVEEDDIVVARTNGLLDNLRESEIEEIINHGVQKDPRQLACLLANLAPYNSFDKYADTFFAQTARKSRVFMRRRQS